MSIIEKIELIISELKYVAASASEAEEIVSMQKNKAINFHGDTMKKPILQL